MGQIEKRRLVAQAFRRRPVPERGEGRNAYRAKADQGAEHRPALEQVAMNDCIAQKGLQDADGANKQDAALAQEIC